MSAAPDERVHGTEEAISTLLRIGVSVSLSLIALGSALSFVRVGGYRGGTAEVARLVGPGGAFPRTADWLAGGLVRLDGQALIVAGLLLLIATPILRVAVSVIAFARERDGAYVLITAIVLALLLASIAIGRAL